ncbi:hypothetical protein GCM10025781_28110 [Kocuria gwangalliensis]|uniref:Uncharacterized protein n=1 Tax=Kocuria gwangalliensis TaxID=501592 RepID=A0ABP8XHL7_9MICC
MFRVPVLCHGDLVQNVTLLSRGPVSEVLVNRSFRELVGQITAPPADLGRGRFD